MPFYDWNGCPLEVRQQVDQLAAAFIQFIPNLTGIYLHGSLAMGCFNPTQSDLDLLVVSQEKMPAAAVPPILASLLEISRRPVPVEVSFLNQQDLRPWQHPALYDLHYSEGWREEMWRQHEDGSWTEKFLAVKRDSDLAAHITMTLKYGVCLWGESAAAVLPTVPPADFADSILTDVDWTSERMLKFPVYTILNLCRGYAFLRDGLILSKAQGAQWALQNLEEKWQKIIQQGLDGYQADSEGPIFTEDEVRSFYNEMAGRINQSKRHQPEIPEY